MAKSLINIELMTDNQQMAQGPCSSASATVGVSSALCDRTDCPSYGKWWCPFTGW
ncbi:MAG: hypothetical protein KRP56_02785 [Candidatus Methanogranum gryphiswaldense]|nr:MAG: hypothetical protein KRP56_02785 [Candidatus Methanogranum sp. U3.2.1]